MNIYGFDKTRLNVGHYPPLQQKTKDIFWKERRDLPLDYELLAFVEQRLHLQAKAANINIDLYR